jgi:hypothetical protein
VTSDETAGAESESDVGQKKAGSTLRRRTKIIVWTTCSVVAAVIGVASIAVPMIADAQQRGTSTDTLVLNPTIEPEADELATSAPLAAASDGSPALGLSEADMNPVDDGPGANMTFWVPIDAPWSTLPDDGWQQAGKYNLYGCSQAQYDWLVTHAVSKATQGGLFDFVNSAADGGALSIRSIRSEGTFSAQTPARVKVDCDGPGIGAGDDFTVVEVTLGADSPAIVAASSILPVGSLFSRDLAPGEVGQVFIRVVNPDPTKDFEGRIVADVVVGAVESTVAIEEGFLWRSAPAIRAGVVNIGDDGMLRCVTLPVTYPLFEDSYSTMPQYYGPVDGVVCSPVELEQWVRGLAVEY